MTEIERKFLVTSTDFKSESFLQFYIAQGYLSSNPERTVRVRIKSDKGFLTIKGKSSESGLSRYEWEKEISVADAEQLFLLCEEGVIKKTRYLIKKDKHVYEVDVFYGENEGLIIAEIELNSEDEQFEKPNWLGAEVTQNVKYFNSNLSKKPFKSW